MAQVSIHVPFLNEVVDETLIKVEWNFLQHFSFFIAFFLDPTVISANFRRIVSWRGDFEAIFGTSVPIPSLNTAEKITDEFIEVEY